MKNNRKTSAGITLIALVVTIIVLLILAGISISMLSGDNSILQKATDAKTNTEKANEKEQIQMEVLGSFNKNGNLEIETVNSNIKKNISGVTTDDATEFPLIVTYTSTGNSYTVDGNGNVTKAVIYPLVDSTLKEGDYVIYNNDRYRVLYDKDSKYNWVEIISVNSLQNVILGKNDTTSGANGALGSNIRAMWSYNNAITTLNNIAQGFLNLDYADRARCVGSDPENMNNEGQWRGSYGMRDGDNNDNSDTSKLNEIGAMSMDADNENGFWFASRSSVDGQRGLDIYAYVKFTNMIWSDYLVYYCDMWDNQENKGYAAVESVTAQEHGFRPVIRLKDEIKVISGNGTSDSPYMLQK